MPHQPPHPPSMPYGSGFDGEPYMHPPGPPPPRRGFTITTRMLVIIAIVAAFVIAGVVGLIIASSPPSEDVGSSNTALGQHESGVVNGDRPPLTTVGELSLVWR